MGRPIEYEHSYAVKAEKYLEECQDGYHRVLQSQNKKRKIYTKKFQVKLPNIGGLAVYLNIARSTIYEWAQKYQDFSDILEKILAEQESRLISNGLSGEYAPTITKVMMTKHGYREGHEHANPDGTNMFRPSTEDDKHADAALKSS